MDYEKLYIQTKMVKDNEKALNTELKENIMGLKMQINALLSLNAEYSAKIIELKVLLKRLPTTIIQEYKKGNK
jgi:hypothetical protein